MKWIGKINYIYYVFTEKYTLIEQYIILKKNCLMRTIVT